MDKKLLEFLITAKKATYAGKGAETTSSRIKSHDLIYEDGDYMYYDTYLGTGKFAGEEAIWIKDVPYWSMNYIGRVIGANFSGDFLKEALLLVPEEKPFRGPADYTNGDYTYHCVVDGSFDWFQGKEIISYKGNEIYECVFHGGLVEQEKTLLAPIMAHAVWNIVGALILGGVSLADDYPHVFTMQASNNKILSGGDCKIEASIITLMLNLAQMVVFIIKNRRETKDK